jgi:hypothetical protein
MMRSVVRAAFGFATLLIAPSFAMAQIALDVRSARDGQPSRSFSQISFGPATRGSATISGAPRPSDRFFNEVGVTPPAITAAPVPHGPLPTCVMRVVPVDPKYKSNMPVVNVDERIDPNILIKIPTCQPRD